MNEYNLQSQSPVLKILQSIPNYEVFYQDFEKDKEKYNYNLLMRETLGFSRYCELYSDNTKLNRQEVHKVLSSYIESQNQIKSGSLLPFQA